MSWTESGSLPAGLTLSITGQLSGVPATAGTYAFTVTVNDSHNPPLTATSGQINVTISDSAIVIAPASPPAGTVTYAYPGFGFSASGGSPPYTWKASGTPPLGLTVGSDGTVSGTPTQAGTFAFSVTATDSAQQPMSSPPLATQIMIGNPGPLTLNPAPAPPAGVVGTPYGPFAFSESGGFQPLKWSIIKGSLPPGLTLGSSDGSLNGTPVTDAASPYAFTVTVTDSAVPQPASQSLPFTITVTLPLPPVINSPEAPTGTVGVAYPPYTFTASNGVLPLAWSETPPLTMGLSLSAQGVLSGTPTAFGQFPITLNAMDAVSRSAPPFPTVVRVSPARPSASFTYTGNMKIPRSGHAATLLLSGKVLVTGGGNGTADATAELYDPVTGTFSSTTGDMTEARSGHTATLLGNSALANYGKVLILGSSDNSAELYDPGSGTFAATGHMNQARTSPTATLLDTGKVLVVGGNPSAADLRAELYDPVSGTFSYTPGSTTILRNGHTATLLDSGQVLIAGGNGTTTAELYDPVHGTFTATTGNMTEARAGHTATRLGTAANAVQSGYVLIIGPDLSAELYEPSTQTFARVGSLPSLTVTGFSNGGSPAGFSGSRNSTTLRSDGTVLAAGGSKLSHCYLWGVVSRDGGALFAPESDGFTVTGSLNTARNSHTATVLQDGTILVVGGTQNYFATEGFRCIFHFSRVLSSAELFK